MKWSSAQGEGNKGPESQQMLVTSTRAMTPFQSVPSLATVNSTHMTPILLHQANVCFPKSLEPPRTQHKSRCDSRGGCCPRSVFLPTPNTHNEEISVSSGDSMAEGRLPLDWRMGPWRLQDGSELSGELGTLMTKFCFTQQGLSLPLLVTETWSIFV